MLIKKCEGVDLKHYNGSKATTECPNAMDRVFENIEEYNLNKERKILIVFDYMIADMLSIRKTSTNSGRIIT